MPCKNILLLFAALFVEYGLKDSQGELLSMDELISYLLGAPSLFDPILWVILLLSALTGFGISWSKAKQLGVQYGEKNHLKSVWKTCFLTVFFISELIAVIRALFAAIRFAGRSSSVWMFFPVFILYFSVLMLSIFVGSKVQRRMVRQWEKSTNRKSTILQTQIPFTKVAFNYGTITNQCLPLSFTIAFY